jgi:predicted N-acetyltransferase YhbS
MKIEIRKETPNDYKETEMLTREAFWDVYKPGCDEHLIVHKLRSIEGFIKELDLVALEDNKVVGNIMYSKALVIDNKNEYEVLNLGPISVMPSKQKEGIGSLLMNKSIAMVREMAYKGIFLFGNPQYYGKFGFVNAATFGITTSTGEYFDAFMALELLEGSLGGVTGKFHYDKVFETDANELEAFEKLFPKKQKHKLSTQLFQ